MTLQLTREQGYSRGFFSPRSVTGFLSDVYPAAADEVGKIYLIADERVCIIPESNLLLLPFSASDICCWLLSSSVSST